MATLPAAPGVHPATWSLPQRNPLSGACEVHSPELRAADALTLPTDFCSNLPSDDTPSRACHAYYTVVVPSKHCKATLVSDARRLSQPHLGERR